MDNTTVSFDNDNESWLVSRESRHNKDGWKVRRYTWDDAHEMSWDEQYMFFESLDKVYDAFLSGKLDEAREAF